MANVNGKTPRKTPAPLSISELMAAWLGAVDGVETSTADIAARLVADLNLTKDETKFFAAPKSAEEKANNRHVSIYEFVFKAVEENIVVKGKRIAPATVAALRDKNVEGKELLQGIPKSVSDATCWVGQIKVRVKTLRAAVERHLEAGGKTTARNEKSDKDFVADRLQAIFNRANKSETFDLADVAAFNGAVQNLAKMCGITLKAVK